MPRGSRSSAPVAKVARLGRLSGLKSGLNVVINQMRLPATQPLASYSFNSSSFSVLVPAPRHRGVQEKSPRPVTCVIFPGPASQGCQRGEQFRLPPILALLTGWALSNPRLGAWRCSREESPGAYNIKWTSPLCLHCSLVFSYHSVLFCIIQHVEIKPTPKLIQCGRLARQPVRIHGA